MPAMPRRKTEPPADGRKARRDDPPYMDWRGGRPVWNPGPALRRDGWTLIPLKSETGDYLKRGLARIMAREINRDVALWRDRPNDPALRYAPHGEAALIASPDRAARNLANGLERFKAHRTFKVLAAKTRAEYTKSLARFIAWGGDKHPETINRKLLTAFYEAEWDHIFARRALGWTEEDWTAAPRTSDADGARHVAAVRAERWLAYDDYRDGGPNVPGLGQINAIIRAVSRLYSFMDLELNWVTDGYNPASKFRLDALKPRLVLPSDDALVALVEAAEGMGLASVGDALVILSNAGPRPGDMIGWTVDMWATGRITGRIRKTNAQSDFKFPAVLQRRMTQIQTRRAEAGQQGQPLILMTEAQGVAYTVSHLSHQFDDVRTAAAAQARTRKEPALAEEIEGLTVYDFRKKAITRLHAAGNSRDDIAAITRHSFKTVSTILDHYIIPTGEVADKAVDRLDAYMKERGVKW